MSVVTWLLLAAWPALAFADSADPGDRCNWKRGASYLQCGADEFDVVCVPDRCKTDADCEGAKCTELPVCLDWSDCSEQRDAGRDPIESLIGECDDDRMCAGGAVCKTERLCVRRTLEDDDGCAVRAPGAGESRSWVSGLLAAALLGVFLFSRRRLTARRHHPGRPPT